MFYNYKRFDFSRVGRHGTGQRRFCPRHAEARWNLAHLGAGQSQRGDHLQIILHAMMDLADQARLSVQGGRHLPLMKRLSAPKALMLDGLSRQFRKRAVRANIAFNTAFAGAYDFVRLPDFAVLMQQFLHGLPDGALVMCHPGFVDETLEGLDPLTHQREHEHAYLASEQFLALMQANKLTLE